MSVLVKSEKTAIHNLQNNILINKKIIHLLDSKRKVFLQSIYRNKLHSTQHGHDSEIKTTTTITTKTSSTPAGQYSNNWSNISANNKTDSMALNYFDDFRDKKLKINDDKKVQITFKNTFDVQDGTFVSNLRFSNIPKPANGGKYSSRL